MDKQNPALILAEKTNYLNKNIQYLRNLNITEYDIEAAGFSVIRYKKLLPEDEIKHLETLPKYERNVAIGLHIKKKPEINVAIHETLAEVRKAFVLANKIQPYSILSIKKDAIFIIKENPSVLKFTSYFNFRKKNIYTSYAYLNEKEFYYNSKDNILDIKGLSEESKIKGEFALKEIRKIISQAERLTPELLFNISKQFSRSYLERKLPIEVYREIDTGFFRVKKFSFAECTSDILGDLDISQNYLKYFLPLLQQII